jgi:transposase
MGEGALGMSGTERERGHVIRLVEEKKLRQREAAERLGITARQFRRLIRAWRREGDKGLVSKQRGRVSPRRTQAEKRAKIEKLLRDKYSDFGATLAAEKLAELDKITVSHETVRQMQIKLKLWKPKRRKEKYIHQPRERRPRFGELVQIDGSPHDWFEGRAPRCNLTVFIDDATSRLMALHFSETETTEAYVTALKSYVLAHGMPLALYSDRHGIFRVNAVDSASGDGKTEFNRVTERLKIEQICAHSPQAKGRVERANQTLQDRLIKEMRLRNICSIAEAEAFFPAFIEAHNKKFAVPAKDKVNAHRPWTGTEKMLDDMLARRQTRTLSKALTFRCDGTMYCVKTDGIGVALRGAKVTLYHFASGAMEVHYAGGGGDRILPCTAFKTYPVPPPTVDEKTLNARVDACIAKLLPVGVLASFLSQPPPRQGCG